MGIDRHPRHRWRFPISNKNTDDQVRKMKLKEDKNEKNTKKGGKWDILEKERVQISIKTKCKSI